MANVSRVLLVSAESGAPSTARRALRISGHPGGARKIYKNGIEMTQLAGKGKRFAKRIYRLRVVGLGIGFFCVASVFAQMQASSVLWALLVFYGFVWPHAAYRLALAREVPYRGERLNLLIDAAFGGLWLVAMRFNVLPSVLILAMLGMNNIAAGGVRLFLKGVVAHVCGAAIGLETLGFALEPQSQMPAYRLSQKLAERSKELERLSQTDGLTGLWNRRYWESLLADEFERCRVEGASSCLLLLDLDYFKLVNDTQGHCAGDSALQGFADVLKQTLRGGDIIGRYGGEEFGAILSNSSLPEAREIVERLLQRIRVLANQHDARCPCTASAGLAEYKLVMPSHHAWLQDADRCLYGAKTRGRNRLVVGSESDAGSTRPVPRLVFDNSRRRQSID
jgi:diguanylate cyclase